MKKNKGFLFTLPMMGLILGVAAGTVIATSAITGFSTTATAALAKSKAASQPVQVDFSVESK